MTARRPRKSGTPMDQCDPPEMVEVLLSRLKDSQLDESKKSLLCVELNDILWFFEKHPESTGIFRSDMLDWRKFLKQSKAYMDDMFETRMARTKKIMDYVMGKPKSFPRKDTIKETPQPSYYEILFRPGIRSVRKHPINVEHYGEHNATIDKLHKLIATMREEIVYAPQRKMSRDAKKVFLDILLSIVEICAYDVLDGIGFLEEMRVLVNSIVEGEEYRKKTNIVSYMSSLTSKLKEHAKCHWMQGNLIKRKMWDDIASIEKDLGLKNKPKFNLELLSKSNFLRMEKMKEIGDESIKTQTGDTAENKEYHEEQGLPAILHDGSSLSESFYEPSSVLAVQKYESSPLEARGCENAEHRMQNDIKIPEYFVDISLADDSVGCGLSSGNVCTPKLQLKRGPSKLQPAGGSATSPVIEWANNIRATYGGACQCEHAEDEDTCENKGEIYIPDAAVEEETIFKSKKYPRTTYGVLKHVVIPPAPDDTDVDTPLIDILRIELQDGQDELQNRDSPELPSDMNPILARRRLLKY